MSQALARGTIVWVDFSPTRGREHRGVRPALVVASADYLASVPDLAIVVPITSVDRSWPHHVLLDGDSGLPKRSFAMTEQPRTISRSRITSDAGVASESTLAQVDQWLSDFIGL